MSQESLSRFLPKFVDAHLGIWLYEPNTSKETWTSALETILEIGPRDGRSLRTIFPELDGRIDDTLRDPSGETSCRLFLPEPARFFSCDLKRHDGENDTAIVFSAEIRKFTPHNASPDKTFLNVMKVFAQSPGTVVFMTDVKGDYTYLAGSGLEYLGVVPEQWLGRSIFEFLKDYPVQSRNAERIFQGESFFDQSRFGDHFFEDRIFPMFGPEEEFLGIAGIQVDVTRKIEILNDLQQSNALLNNLFDSIPEKAFILDRKFKIVRANAACRTFSDAPPIEVPCFEAIHDRFTPCDSCPVEESFETGRQAMRVHFDEKQHRFFELTSFPIRDRNTDEIIGAIEMIRDITDRKRMEESLLRNQALLDDLLEVLDQGIFLIDSSYTITRVNDAMRRMYPELDPLVGKKCYETTIYGGICPDCAAACMFREGKATSRTFFEKNSEEQPGIWLELTVFPLYEFGSDYINGAICILRNVTPRIEMESQLDEYRSQIHSMAERRMSELRLSEAKLRSILETCGAAIAFADYQGRYTYVNGKFKEMFGYSQEDILGKPATCIVTPRSKHRADAERLMKSALENRIDSFRITHELTTRDGRVLWGDVSASVIRGNQPHEAQLVFVILDVTAQQELVEQLNKARIAAEDASREKSQFLATMSHEIRTPLNGVIGISHLLMNTPLQPKQLEYARLIKASGESLLFLINDILDFSKIEAGKFELVETEFLLHDLVESVISILASKADEKYLDLIATHDIRVPGPLVGDPGRLQQILINLVGNALKFTERGGVRLHVALDAIREKGIRLKFSISDTGIGIPEERRNRLFRQFSQVDSSSTRAYGGTGLGLAISKRLVELMGGEIHVESVVDGGSTFWFTALFRCDPIVLKCMSAEEYPCITEKRDYCKGVSPEYCARSGRDVAYLRHVAALGGVKTLLFGTGQVKIPALVDQFHIWKMPVETAITSEEAFERLREATDSAPFRLIVVDFQPHNAGAEQFVRAVQDDETLGGIAVVALTSLSEDLHQRSWRHHDSIRYVTKPVCCSVLLDEIVRLFFSELPQTTKTTPEETSQAAAQGGDEPMIRVLVAEDNRINQIVITEILQNARMAVTLAVNGIEAFEKFRTESFDAIVMDCQMPVMDGYQTTRKIREWEMQHGAAPLPIVALTANATSEDEAKCLEAGMNVYCCKPVGAEELVGKILQNVKRNVQHET